MAPHRLTSPSQRTPAAPRLPYNADAFAIAIALGLAALVRFNLLPSIGW